MIETRTMEGDDVAVALCLNCGCAYSRDAGGRVWEPGEPPEAACLDGGRCRCHLAAHEGCAVTADWKCDNPSHAALVL